MKYITIDPPFTLRFHEMDKKELRAYFKWFQEILPQRVEHLTRVVQDTPGFANWSGGFAPGDLDILGQWFASQVATRLRTREETSELADQLAFPIEIPATELTDRTISLAYDLGMYLSQLFLANHSEVRWEHIFGGKSFIDYGQPVLRGFGRVPFNPTRMMITLAYGLTSQKRDGNSLREIYDIWQAMIVRQTDPNRAEQMDTTG